MFLKTVTLSSWNPIFHQFFVSTCRMHFWRLCRKFCANNGRISYWNPEIDEKFRNIWKKTSILSSRIGKLSLVNSEETRLCLIKIFSPLSSKIIRKTKFFRKFFFFKMIFRTGKMQLWRICRTFPPKVRQFFVYSPNVTRELLHFPAGIQFCIKCSSLHVKVIFDNCAEIFELNMETIQPQIPKILRKYKIVGVKPQNWTLELKNAVLSLVQKQRCH